MDVIAFWDIGNGAPYIFSVLDDRVAVFEIFQGKLVAQWYGFIDRHCQRLVAVHDPALKGLASGDALDNNDPNGVACIVDKKIRCRAAHSILLNHLLLFRKSYIRILIVL